MSSSGRGDKPTANGGARRARAHADSASPPISRPDMLMGSGTETTATAKLFLKDGRLTGMISGPSYEGRSWPRGPARNLAQLQLAGSTTAVGDCMTPRGARSGAATQQDLLRRGLGRILRLSVERGEAEHVRELVWPSRATRPCSCKPSTTSRRQRLQRLHTTASLIDKRDVPRRSARRGHAAARRRPSKEAVVDRPRMHAWTGAAGVDLFLAVEEGLVEVVRVLMEVGGRELAMMTRNNGVSCLSISALKGHLDVVKALLEAGGRELVMPTRDDGTSCLSISAQKGHSRTHPDSSRCWGTRERKK